MGRARWLLALTSGVVFFACSPPKLGPGMVSDSQLITEDEIEGSRAATAYEAIQKLRANFLSYRGETSFDKARTNPYPTVWLDGQEFGPLSSLKNLPASQIASIRLYRAWEASTKFGTGYPSGVIAVTTRQ